MLTREERNVLVFVALGILLGAVPWPEPEGGQSPDRAGPSGVETVEVDLFPIDLNRAGPALLEQLPGIGAVKARAIVELREARGSLRSVDELEEVRGIGPRTVERLRGLVTTGRPASGPPGNDRERGNVVGSTGSAAAGESDPHRGPARPSEETAEVER